MKWNRIFNSNKCTCMFQHPWPKTDALSFKETGRRKNTCIIRLIYGYLSTNITNYYHFKFVFINQTKIKVSKIYIFLVKNVLFTPVLTLKLKSVSMRKPGRSRQEVIMLKSPISLKLGTNVRYQELAYVTECQVKILNSLGGPGSPCKNRHFARLCIIN